MRLSPGKSSIDSLFKEVRAFNRRIRTPTPGPPKNLLCIFLRKSGLTKSFSTFSQGNPAKKARFGKFGGVEGGGPEISCKCSKIIAGWSHI